jgi:hypothetical protein
MSEWWTYSLSDMLLFSPRVYYRLFELHNHALWPAQLATVAAGLGMVFALARPSTLLTRITFVVLGILWIWIAWAFFGERYATINWAAPYVAPAYGLEGLMLIATGLLRNRFSFGSAAAFTRTAAIILLAAILIGYPLIAPAVGRSWSAAEVFGIAPDPTALATLAVLAASPRGGRLVLMVIPLLWIFISTATLWTLQTPEYWIAPLAAVLALAITCLRMEPRRSAA